MLAGAIKFCHKCFAWRSKIGKKEEEKEEKKKMEKEFEEEEGKAKEEERKETPFIACPLVLD